MNIPPALGVCLSLFLSAASRADLLVVNSGPPSTGGWEPPAVLRFSQATGAPLGAFSRGHWVESMGGCAFGPDGNLYVTANNVGLGAVLRYNGVSGAFIDEFVPLGSWGLTAPTALRFGPNGDLFVGSVLFDPNIFQFGPGRVFRFSGSNGAFLGVFVPDGSGGLTTPHDLAFGPGGHLLVADASAVLSYDGFLGAFRGAFVTNGSGGLNRARGLAFGPDGNLYVTCSSNSVLRYNGLTGAFMDQFIPPGRGGLEFPAGLVFGPDGRLYVRSKDAVIRYDGKTGALVDVFVPPGALGAGASPVFTPSPPTLKFEHSPVGLILRWPLSAVNHRLEYRPSLDAGPGWSGLTSPASLLGGEFVVTNRFTEPAGFFRLRRP